MRRDDDDVSSSTPTMPASDLDCFTRTCNAALATFGFGSIVGALKATWAEAPLEVRGGRSFAAVSRTGAMMAEAGATFAAIGACYVCGSCLAKQQRGGKEDFWNGVVGGLCAGAVVGLRRKKMSAAVGSGAAFAIASAAVDATGGSGFRGNGLFDDNATPGRIYFPYEEKK